MKNYYSIIKFMGILLITGLLLASCSTANFVKSEKTIHKVTDLVYQQQPENLAAISGTPFLFDSEILLRKADIASLWENLAAAGFRLPEAEIVSADTVGGNSWKAFGEGSLEVESFFANYVSEDAALTELKSGQGRYLLLLDGKAEGGYPRIIGIRGPLNEN